MQQIFWESTHVARKEHFCDRCHEWIGEGDTYSRKMWRPQRGIWHVLKEHDQCPSELWETAPAAVFEEVEAIAGLRLEIRLREVLVLSRNGEITTILEPEIVPVVLLEDDDDEEILF